MRLAISLLACAIAAAQPSPVRQRLAAIAPRMQAMVDDRTIPGAPWFVAQRGEILAHHAVGWQDLDARRPMRPDSIFQIMSMTKPITAAAQPGPGGPHRPIALYQILTHTSGMETDPPPDRRKEIQYEMTLPLSDTVRFFATLPLRTLPGAQWNYSNMGIATIGRVVEAVSGLPYEKFMRQRLLFPLGMNDSFFFPDAAHKSRIALLHRRDNGKLVLPGANVLGGDPTAFRNGARYPAPEFGLYSTAADVAALYQMMLDGGVYHGRRLLSRSTVEVMTALHTGTLTTFNLGAGNGLAFTVPRDGDATYDLVSPDSFGHGGAFGTWSFADRAKSLVAVFMVQIAGPETNRPQHVFNAMVEAAIDRAK